MNTLWFTKGIVAAAGEVCAAVLEGQKNDFRDAEAIAEAVQRARMPAVSDW